MILFPGFTLLAGPKHSTSVPFSAGSAVPLSVDEKDGPIVPNPLSDLDVKMFPGPQIGEESVLCTKLHLLLSPSLLVFTLQMVSPFTFPTTVHLKVKVSPGQVGGTAVSCPATSSVAKYSFCKPQYVMYLKSYLCTNAGISYFGHASIIFSSPMFHFIGAFQTAADL